MARTEIAVNNLSLNAGTIVTETTLAAGATGTAGYTVTGLKQAEDLRLEFKNEDGSATGAFEIDSGGYLGASQGDLTVYAGPGLVSVVTLDSSRFRQTDATIDINTVGVTGSLRAHQ